MNREGFGFCHLGFGELIQGISSKGPFLVNFPIDSFSCAEVKKKESLNSGITIFNGQNFYKSKKAINNFLRYLNIKNISLEFKIHRDLPTGCGLSSSTADLIASIRATANLLNLSQPSPDLITNLIKEIEPNDGLQYPGISFYDHINSRRFESLPFLSKPIFIVSIFSGNKIDTIEFNKKINYSLIKKYIERYDYLITEVCNSIKNNDHQLLFYLSTQSTILWDEFLPNKNLKEILNFSRQTKSLGLINSHSGNLIGFCYPIEMKNNIKLIEDFTNYFKQVPLCHTSIVSKDSHNNLELKSKKHNEIK
tara:strand:- start:8287 stop:9210 length:924 start_codon:yes stop_codon:yes gene_type:complete